MHENRADEILFALLPLVWMTSPENEPPIACQLHALAPGERHRQQALLESIRGKVLRIVEFGEGFELQFPSDPDTFTEVAEWVGSRASLLRLRRFPGPVPS